MIFHGRLEERVKEYSLKDVIKHPIQYSKWDGIQEIFSDLNYESLFKKNKFKSALNDLFIFASFGLSTIPHELLHAITNTITGGKNNEIVINKLYGGDLAELIDPELKSRWLFPIFRGHVDIANYGSELAKYATGLSPYIMTPLGIFLLKEAKKRKSLPLAFLGSGALTSHVGAVIGDFANTGKNIISDTFKFLGVDAYNDDNWLIRIPIMMGGIYLGAKIASFSYRFFKSSINSLQDIFEDKTKL